jgi:hypothetical protein
MTRRKLPLWDDGAKSRAFEIGRLKAREILSRGRAPEDVFNLVTQVATDAEAMIAAARKEYPPPSPIECKEGCSWCCHIKVTVSAPEVLRVADYLRQTLSPEELSKVHQRIVDADDKTRGMTSEERGQSKQSCPLLIDDRCSVYAARPLPCSGWVSLQADVCKRAYENTAPGVDLTPETYVPHYEIYHSLQAGMGLGVAQEGLDGSVLELIAALRIALDRPNATERWAQGRQVFSQARDDEYASKVSPRVAQGLRGDRGLRR